MDWSDDMEKDRERNEQSQAMGATVRLLKDVREVRTAEQLKTLDSWKAAADSEMERLKDSVRQVMESNRGGAKGMHGFIGERAQVYIMNARSLLDGKAADYVLLDDNGPTDYTRAGRPIQQKAVQADKALGLTHVAEHAAKYPFEFVEKNGVYQIPRDFYETFRRFLNMDPMEAGRLRTEDLRMWERVQAFRHEHPNLKIEPMVVGYPDIQAGAISETIQKEEDMQEKKYAERRENVEAEGRPSLKEGLKVAAISAVAEGVIDGGLSAMDRIRQGTKLRDFNREDWKVVGIDAVRGCGKGVVRGGTMYVLVNTAKMPAPMASAVVSASFSSAKAVKRYAKGEIDGKACAVQMADGCCNAAVCAVFAKIGEKVIPIKIVGPLIGSVVGNWVYRKVQKYLAGRSARRKAGLLTA